MEEGGTNHSEKRNRTAHTHTHTHNLETRGPNNCGEVTLIRLPAGDSGSNKEKMTQLQPGRRSAGPAGDGGWLSGGGGRPGKEWEETTKMGKAHTHTHTGVTFVKTTICDYAQPGRTEASGKDCWFTELQPAGGLFRRQCELNENLKVPEELLFNIHSDGTPSLRRNVKSPSFTAVISAISPIPVQNHTHAFLTSPS